MGIQIEDLHASIIIEDLGDATDVDEQNRLIIMTPVERQGHPIPMSNHPRQLHMRYKDSTKKEMVLAFDKKSRDLVCPRYIGVCSVFTSWKTLQCIALRNCTKEHSIIRDDCATFAKEFSEALLRDLKIDGKEIEKYMKELGKLIVIVDESARAEASAREVAGSI